MSGRVWRAWRHRSARSQFPFRHIPASSACSLPADKRTSARHTEVICSGFRGISGEMLHRPQSSLRHRSDSRFERPCTRHLLPRLPAPGHPASVALLPESSIYQFAAPGAGSGFPVRTAKPAPSRLRWRKAAIPPRPALRNKHSSSFSSSFLLSPIYFVPPSIVDQIAFYFFLSSQNRASLTVVPWVYPRQLPRGPFVPPALPVPARRPRPAPTHTLTSPLENFPHHHRSAPGKCVTTPAPWGLPSPRVHRWSGVQTPAWLSPHRDPEVPPIRCHTRLGPDPDISPKPF